MVDMGLFPILKINRENGTNTKRKKRTNKKGTKES